MTIEKLTKKIKGPKGEESHITPKHSGYELVKLNGQIIKIVSSENGKLPSNIIVPACSRVSHDLPGVAPRYETLWDGSKNVYLASGEFKVIVYIGNTRAIISGTNLNQPPESFLKFPQLVRSQRIIHD